MIRKITDQPLQFTSSSVPVLDGSLVSGRRGRGEFSLLTNDAGLKRAIICEDDDILAAPGRLSPLACGGCLS